MTETTDFLSLGQKLKNARQALQLSIDEVVQRTNLKKNHIEALEDDIFILQNVPPAFVRGYVRNYVRFLRLPESLIETVNYGEVTIPKEVKRVAPIKPSNAKSQIRWVRGLTWLVLLTAVGMTLAWWWQEHKKDQASSEALIGSTEVPIAVENRTESASVSLSVETPVVLPQNNGEERLPATPAQAVSNTNETTPTEAVAENTVATDNKLQPEDTQNNSSVTPVNVLQQVEPVAEPQDANEDNIQTTNVAINDELHIEVVGGQSWITVRDAKNKRLAEKLYNPGDVLTFNGNGQYRLTIGAPANVKIHYQGQQVPLKIDGRVARFRLPLAQ